MLKQLPIAAKQNLVKQPWLDQLNNSICPDSEFYLIDRQDKMAPLVTKIVLIQKPEDCFPLASRHHDD